MFLCKDLKEVQGVHNKYYRKKEAEKEVFWDKNVPSVRQDRLVTGAVHEKVRVLGDEVRGE